MKKQIMLSLLCICLIAMTGCRAKETSLELSANEPIMIPLPTEQPSPSPEPEPTEDLTGKVISLLSGNYIDEDAAKMRPVAVVINNIRKALPQSGISQADIIYEVLSEGDITRLIAVFQDFDSEKIGPVRSSRHYFLNFARDNDAIFVHHGSSDQGYGELRNLKVSNIDGMSAESATFWRDPVRVNQAGMYEHSSYTNATRILRQAENWNYRLEIAEDYEAMFEFYDEFKEANGETANILKIPFSPVQDATFEYDSDNKVYKRFQHGQEHIDEETDLQLSVSNVIIQFADMYVMQNDAYGRRNVELITSGNGYLITGGGYTPITWSKESYSSPTQWFDENGEKIKLNKGKTWICITDSSKDIEIQ